MSKDTQEKKKAIALIPSHEKDSESSDSNQSPFQESSLGLGLGLDSIQQGTSNCHSLFALSLNQSIPFLFVVKSQSIYQSVHWGRNPGDSNDNVVSES